MAKDTKAVSAAVTVIDQQEDNALVVVGNTLPDYIDRGGNRGNEGVGREDLVVPRIEVAQALSKCLDESNEALHIPGAKQGNLYNSLNRRLYGSSVIVVPVAFNKAYLVWKDQKKGGGFRGSYPTEALAREAIAREIPAAEQADWDAIETAQHLVVIAKASGELEEAMVSMSRTKLKASRAWNSLIRQAGGDRFSRAYELAGVKERNSQNQEYYNFTVRPVGFPTQVLYNKAKMLYEDMQSGSRTIVMDTSDMDIDGGAAPAGGQKTEF